MGPSRRLVKGIPTENVGIDPTKLSDDDISDLVNAAENALRENLSSSISSREEYDATVKIEVTDKEVILKIDVTVHTRGPPGPYLEARIDEAISKAMDVVRNELRNKAPKDPD